MKDLIVGSIFVLAGMLTIVFRERFVRYSTEYRNKYLGYNFGEKTIKFGTKFAVFLGFVIVVYGILIALGLSDDLSI
jgi:hypothetical protein